MKARCFAVAILFVGLPLVPFCQENNSEKSVTLSGTVLDANTFESLPGASIEYENENRGVLSNSYGYFSLTSRKGLTKTLRVRYVGYSEGKVEVVFSRDSVIKILLSPTIIMLDEVSVEEDTDHTYSFQIGKSTFTADKIRSIASFGGEPDVLKSLQFLPGVQSGNEGTTNISVRGGSYDQNLILVDEAPVYNPSHALSFFSIFNIDAIHAVDFYNGSIPIRYGGRLSSVVDARMKEGNRKKTRTSASIGIVSSKATTEGPLFDNGKWSYMLSGRYSYAGHVVNTMYFFGQKVFNDRTANRSTTNNKINFFDLNGKINFSPNERNKFFISSYAGHDRFNFQNITTGYDLGWGNRTVTLRWNHTFTKKLFSNTSLITSHYNYKYRLLNNTQYFLWTAAMGEQQIKQDYDWYLNDLNHVTFGFGIQRYRISPGMIRPRDDEAASAIYRLDLKKALSSNFYIGNTAKILEDVQLSVGIRYTNFGLTGKRQEYIFENQSTNESPVDSVETSSFKPVHMLEPRVNVFYKVGRNRIGLSYDRTSQFLHLLANSSVGLPTDIWWPTSSNIAAGSADIFVASFERKIGLDLTIHSALFYKSLQNVVDFKDNAKLFVNKFVESQLLQGKGTAYGAELFVSKTYGKLTGSVSYTYSKTYNRINGVNGGLPYPNRYDKRHNVAATFKFVFSERLEASSNFVITSGGALTMPAGSFTFDGVSFNLYSTRNNYRLPSYHRLDLSFKYKTGKRTETGAFKQYWSLDVYNVYGRRNPFTLYSLQQDYGLVKTNTYAFYLYRIVPALSFNFVL